MQQSEIDKLTAELMTPYIFPPATRQNPRPATRIVRLEGPAMMAVPEKYVRRFCSWLMPCESFSRPKESTDA